MQWAVNDPSRFLKERNELEQLAKDADWLTACVWRLSSNLVVEVDLDFAIHGKYWQGTLTYPDLFPETPAYVRPRDSSELWSGHQYGPGGSLCLEWRADNWQPNVTGADLVKSTHRLLSVEQHPEKPMRVPSDHHVTQGQALRSSENRLVSTAGLLTALDLVPEGSWRNLVRRLLLHGSTTIAFISKLETSEGEMSDICDLPKGLSSYFPLFAWPEDGKVLRKSSLDRSPLPTSFDELVIFLEENGFPIEAVLTRDPVTNKVKNQFLLLLGSDPISIKAIAVSAGDIPTVQKYDVITPLNHTNRLPAEAGRLSDIRFGIVGMGSMGSKIAVSLARSGARRFLLVDDDYLV